MAVIFGPAAAGADEVAAEGAEPAAGVEPAAGEAAGVGATEEVKAAGGHPKRCWQQESQT